MPFLKNIFFFIFTVFIFESCNNIKNQESENIRFIIDSLQSVYAPDKRVILWISNTENKKVTLWTENKDAFDEINRILNNRFPHFEKEIQLLPESNQGIINAIVNNSVANLRSKPKHSAELATQALLGTPLRIYKKQGEWYLVQTPNRYIAWIDSAAIVEVSQHDVNIYKQAEKVVFTPVSGFSYSLHDKSSQTVSDLVMGCILPVTDSIKNYYKVIYPDKRKGWVLKKEVISWDELAHQKPDSEKLIATAKKFLGFPYLWGGTSSKAVDCSGFTSTIYFMNGIILQRDASQQTRYGKVITTSYKWNNLLPGDLLFFGRPASSTKKERVTHVALYLGNSEFIHASGKVRINSMDSNQTNYIKSYEPRFVRAIRIYDHVDNHGIEYLQNNKFYKEITENEK